MMLMYSLLGLLGALALSPMGVSAMDCSFGTSKNIIDKVIKSCPRPIIDDDDEQFCCISNDGNLRCCDFPEFVGSMTFYFLPYIIALLIISCLVSCVCCLCCPFCCCYRKRSTGRVII